MTDLTLKVGDRVRSTTYPGATQLVGTIHHATDVEAEINPAFVDDAPPWMVQWDPGQSQVIDTFFVDRITPEFEDDLELVTEDTE